MNKIITAKQRRFLEDERKKEIRRRFYHRNWEAMKWCNKQGLTVYASAQAHNQSLVKLFVQKGVPFKPLNDKVYDQEDPEQVMEYIAEIDKRYEMLYNKMKDKV